MTKTPLMRILDLEYAKISLIESSENYNCYAEEILSEETYMNMQDSEKSLFKNEERYEYAKQLLSDLNLSKEGLEELKAYSRWWFRIEELMGEDLFLSLFGIYRYTPQERDYHSLPDIGELY